MRSVIIVIFLVLVPFISISQEADSLKREYKKYYGSNGNLISEGFLENGKPTDYWKSYYPEGGIKSEGNRLNFQLSGPWIFYNSSGDTLEIINYRKDKKSGYHIAYEYTVSGNKKQKELKFKELYLNGLKENKSYYYKDGKLFQEVNYEQGVKNGMTREYSPDGRVIKLLEYRKNILISVEKINALNADGKKTGIWKTFYPTGKVHIAATYLNGILDGVYKEYNLQGQVVKLLRYKQGELVIDSTEKESPVKFKKEFYSNGKVKQTGSFQDTIPVGLHTFFNKDGAVEKAEVYDNIGLLEAKGLVDDAGQRTGKWEEYYDDGILRAYGNYKDGLKDGEWTYLFKDGSIEQKGPFRKGKFHGQWIWYYDSGELWREEEFYMGTEDGQFTEYLQDGSIISKGVYDRGSKEGAWFYHSGDHIEKGEFRSDLKEGEWKYYYSNEKLKFEGSFIQGQEDGRHFWYYENGNIEQERFYIYGSKERQWKFYNEDGTLYKTVSYRDNEEYKVNGKVLEKKD